MRPTGDRVRSRRIPLRVGVDYGNRWTTCPGKTCRILGVTGARAVDERGEVTLQVPFADMCKDWPSPVSGDIFIGPRMGGALRSGEARWFGDFYLGLALAMIFVFIPLSCRVVC